MLAEIYPRDHARFQSLRLLGPHLNGFVVWLRAQGYPRYQIRMHVRQTQRLDVLLRRRGVRHLKLFSRVQLLKFVGRASRVHRYFDATIRSLTKYLDSEGLLAAHVPTPREHLVCEYCRHLLRVRGIAASTASNHCDNASELLKFLGFDRDPAVLGRIKPRQIELFVRALGARLSRASLQQRVARLRSFLRYLTACGAIDSKCDFAIDTPRLYRGERLPRALSWETVQAFLAAIDRSTPKGKRDYAMFMLIATYGLRTCEVAALRLEHFEWRSCKILVPRSKANMPIVLPLTIEVGAAVLDYLRHARAALAHREVFLRIRSPAGPVTATTITNAFIAWSQRTALSIPYQGPHCIRHSLAVHLLRQRTSLKAIGDLLGHRSAESTCVYLRLHVDDLRDAALDLPKEMKS